MTSAFRETAGFDTNNNNDNSEIAARVISSDEENEIMSSSSSSSSPSSCPSLDRRHVQGKENEDNNNKRSTTTRAITSSSSRSTCSTDNNYDTDFFGGSHDGEDGGDGIDEEFEPPLSWRLDPAQSLSDWTIKVTHLTSGRVMEYPVHRNILAVGPRKSEYFCSLFRCSSLLAESRSNTSDIVLEDAAADCFPQLLDFLYSPTELLFVTTETAVALRYLAQYFGMRRLHKKVMEFLRQDISLSTATSYINDTCIFQDEKVSHFVADTCAENILDITPTSALLSKISPDFFYHVISSPDIDTCAVSSHVSVLVASYCKQHQDDMDEATFLRLTNRNHMPIIDHEASLTLLELQVAFQKYHAKNQNHNKHLECTKHYNGHKAEELETKPQAISIKNVHDSNDDDRDNNNHHNDDDSINTKNQKVSPNSELTCLQQRCIKVLALHWKDVSGKGRLQANSVFEKLPPSVVLELMDKSLSIAKQRLEESNKMVEATRLKMEQEFDMKLGRAIQKYRREQQVLERLQRNTTERINQLRLQLAEKDRQVAEYQQELNRYVRVPPTYSFQDLKMSTYHHQSQPEPFDNATYLCRFGRRRPTVLPRIGDRTEDGYLYVTQKGNFYERWPVYYYRDD